jgi:hypothetical protein
MLPGVEVTFDAELWIWAARRTDSWTFVCRSRRPCAGPKVLNPATPPRSRLTCAVRIIDGRLTFVE